MTDLREFPGADLILPGVKDLQNGNAETIGALLIAIAATRLTEAGLEFPADHLVSEPEITLYTYLENVREDAYARYNALLGSLNSFCSALEAKNKEQVIVAIGKYSARTLPRRAA